MLSWLLGNTHTRDTEVRSCCLQHAPLVIQSEGTRVRDTVSLLSSRKKFPCWMCSGLLARTRAAPSRNAGFVDMFLLARTCDKEVDLPRLRGGAAGSLEVSLIPPLAI